MLPTSLEDPNIEINSALTKISSLARGHSLFDLSKEYGKNQEALNNKKNSKRAPRKGTKPLVVSVQLFQQIRSIYEFMIFGGVEVTIDDEIHFQSNLQAMSVGSKIINPLQIAVSNSTQRIDCQMNTRNPALTDFQFLSELCRRKQQLNYLELSQIIDIYQRETLKMCQLKQKYLKMSKQYLLENDKEYELFLEYVYQIINSKDQNSIFRYSILRMNYILGDIEYQKFGMSNGFLHMLGLNANLFSQLFLRGKQINLAYLNTKEELFAASKETLLQRMINLPQGRQLCRWIKTVDGFPLKIIETIKKIESPFKQYSLCDYEHFAYFIDYDIDQESLKSLIEYRNAALIEQKKSKFSSQMLEEKLSDSFEDIEYTLKAEEFIQQYYPQQMANMNQNYQKNQVTQTV